LQITIEQGDDFVPPCGFPPCPPDEKDFPDWTEAIEPNLKPVHPEDGKQKKPVPFIKSLSDSGLLTIGWDELMVPPFEYEKIPERKVAIRDWSAFSPQEIE
jgi:hypothetical protein